MNIFAKIKNKVGEYMGDKKEKKDKTESLAKWQQKFNNAKGYYQANLELMDDRERIFFGTKDVDKNVNSKQSPTKKSNNVQNIVFEFIESAVDDTVPQPSVRPKRAGFERQAQMIEDSIKNDLIELGVQEINDINERTTPIQGMSVMEVCWNNDYRHHLYRGEIEIRNIHPKQLIPQPGVFNIYKMDYFFILSSVTKDYIKRRYNVDVSAEEEAYPEVNSVDGTFNTYNEGEKVTEIVCWYKDKEGDIGKFVWVNDVVLEDLPKYFYRKPVKCEQCQKVRENPEDTKCECGGKFKQANEDFETLSEDVEIYGEDTIDPTGERIKEVVRILPKGAKIPYFIPTRYPIVIRKNVPKNFSLEGQSDVDIIRDQQDSIKKVTTKMEEKLINGGTIIKTLDDHKVQITDQIYQVIKGTRQQLEAMGTMDLTAPIERDISFIQQQYKTAQSMLGITDSFQGKPDPTAKSGVAKQIQVQQAAGRLASKQFNKFIAYRDLFQIMFEFKLAFYDENRPYVRKDEKGQDIYEDFNKYEFVLEDASGEYYYNTDFIITADAGQGLPNDKMFIYEQAKEMFKSEAIDRLQYFTILETLKFPLAGAIKKQIEQQMDTEQQGVNPEEILNNLTPEERAQFNLLPPEEQQALLMQSTQ